MATGFGYRQALELGCFFQVPLFGAHELRRSAAARGLLDFAHGANFEPLDRDGLLPPVAYARHPLGPELHLAGLSDGRLSMRDDCGYTPWCEVESGEQGVIPLYAHWQLLSLAELHGSLIGRSPLVMLAGGRDQLAGELLSRWRGLQDPDYFERLVQGQRDLELLLARTQSLFMPRVRRSYHAGALFDRDGNLLDARADEWAMREQAQFDYAQAAEQSGVTAEDISGRYDDLVTKAEGLDPLKEWRDLVDQVERRKIDALRGEALRAQDLYDAGEVLRHWYRRLAGEDLQEKRDASTRLGASRREVNKQLYGAEELRGNRAALPGILDRFGIYPWKVMLITEGEGDVAMLEEIVRYHTGGAFAQLGIVPHVMQSPRRRGDHRVQELLGALRRLPNYFLLVFDNEGTAPQWVTQLESYKPGDEPFAEAPVLEPEPEPVDESDVPEGWSAAGYHPKRRPEVEVWAEDIEADNFSAAEICEVICALAKRDVRMGEFTLSAAELVTAYDGSNKAIAAVALDLAQARSFQLSKVKLDAELGRYAAAHPKRDGHTRRVLIVAEHLYRLTVAHRQMRGRLRKREREALRRSKTASDPA